MSLVMRVLGAATPSPTPVEVPLAEQASPGVVGFLVTFAVAVAAIGLFLSLTKHLRIVDRRAAQVAREDEAATRLDEVAGPGGPDDDLARAQGPGTGVADGGSSGADGDGRSASGPVSSGPSAPSAPSTPPIR